MLIMGLVHTALALTLCFRGLQEVPARIGGLLTYVDPTSAIVFGWLVFGESPGPVAVIGGLMVLAGNLLGLAGAKEVSRETAKAAG